MVVLFVNYLIENLLASNLSFMNVNNHISVNFIGVRMTEWTRTQVFYVLVVVVFLLNQFMTSI
jgi:hypothetical protein